MTVQKLIKELQKLGKKGSKFKVGVNLSGLQLEGLDFNYLNTIYVEPGLIDESENKTITVVVLSR